MCSLDNSELNNFVIGSTREPRGFGFIQYLDPADAADAQYHMDRQFIAGREITVVFAEENRKKPSEMRVKERSSTPTGRGLSHGHGGNRGGGFNSDKYRRRSPGRRFRSVSPSRSPPTRRHSSRDRLAGRDKRSCKHNASPLGSPAAKRSSSPDTNGQGAGKSWSRSLSPRTARSSPSKSDSLE
uniref:RRM domain-containing protein n=1 Tax=Physcomitrium patens TaxID=3218 RepID=A0A7I4FQ98_PHYPA